MNNYCIFLLEDDESDKLLVEVSFKRSGANVRLTHARTFREAESILGSLPEGTTFDCALFDYLVPGGKVMDLLVHPRLVGVPSIMLTGIKDEDVAIKALQAGFQDYLIKDEVNQSSLLRSVRYAIERNDIKRRLAEANRKLERLIKVDALTGIMNRRGLEEELRSLDYDGKSHIVILLDVDDFKNINDHYGYSAGDEALKTVARKLQTLARNQDDAARIGGDEFMLLLRNQSREQGMVIAERIRSGLEETLLDVDGEELNITVSIGVAQVTEGADVNTLLKLTQKALRGSKVSGKNSIRLKLSSAPPANPAAGRKDDEEIE